VEAEEDDESVDPFPKRGHDNEDSEDGLPEDESENESIFEKLKDEVEHELYNAGPRAVVRKHRDSKLEIRSDL
jgi:hypothetical protein